MSQPADINDNRLTAYGLRLLKSPPTSAPVTEIVDFISETLLQNRVPREDDLIRGELRAMCAEFGYSWPAVVKELRRRVIRQNPFTADLADSDIEVRPSGVIVNHKAIQAITHNLMPFCPFKKRFIATDTYSLTSYEKPCGGWCCPTCGPEKTEALLEVLHRRISGLPEVYWTVTTWGPGLCNRLAGRRRDRAAQTFFYRRTDGIMFILADKSIDGRKDPTWCATMTPAEAIEWITPAMWVPGRQDSRFSDGWEPKDEDASTFDRSSDDENDSFAVESEGPMIPAYVPVTHLTDAEVIAVLAEFRDQVHKRFGIDLTDGVIPLDVRVKIFELLHALVRRGDP